MQERADALIRQGQAAAQAGQHELARRYLQAAVELEPRNVDALLWLAGVQEPVDARDSLRRVLEIDPDNARARGGLSWVEKQIASAAPPPPVAAPPSSGGFTGALRTPSDPTIGGGGGLTGALRRPAAPPPTSQTSSIPTSGGRTAAGSGQDLRASLLGADAMPAPDPVVPVAAAPTTRTVVERTVIERPMLGDLSGMPMSDLPDTETQRYRTVFYGMLGSLGVGVLVFLLALIGIL